MCYPSLKGAKAILFDSGLKRRYIAVDRSQIEGIIKFMIAWMKLDFLEGCEVNREFSFFYADKSNYVREWHC